MTAATTKPGNGLRRLTAIVALAAVAVLAVVLLLGAGGDAHRYKLLFENAGLLVPENEVQIGGHKVGSVESVKLTDDALAEVEISVDQQLHEGTRAVIRATSLAGIANRYISLTPGPNSEPELPDGAVIGPQYTTSPVDLDQVLNAFDDRTRKGLRDFIRAQAAVYEGKGREANRSYKYLEPALAQTNLFLDQLNRDQRMFRRFITRSADLFTAVAARRDDLSASVSTANAAFAAIAEENEALNETLERIAPTFRQSNTAFVNLRAALGDLNSLVDTSKPAIEGLAPLLARATGVTAEAVPAFRDFRIIMSRPGPHNDLRELTATLPRVQRRAARGFDHAERAIADFQPTLEFARAYAPEMVGSLAKLGQVTAYYDANGHYVRTALAGLNLFDYNQATGVLEPLPSDQQYAPYGGAQVSKRCPGGTTQPAPDGSNPFYDPPWPASGLSGDECDPTQVPPGP